MKFRPCIDLHNGKVKQIVGSSLSDNQPECLKTNFVADKPSSYYAQMYCQDNLEGGHIIKLGPGNTAAAIEALQAWPGGMQIGGGISLENAAQWLDRGASHVIVTSCVFKNGKINQEYLDKLVKKIGPKNLVLDLSCRKREKDYYIVTDRWQKFTEVTINQSTIEKFSSYCDEFLIHAADVEGKCAGIEKELVYKLGKWITIPTTYAGGIRNLDDLKKIYELGGGNIDATIGSALDIFGGTGITYAETVAFHKSCQDEKTY